MTTDPRAEPLTAEEEAELRRVHGHPEAPAVSLPFIAANCQTCRLLTTVDVARQPASPDRSCPWCVGHGGHALDCARRETYPQPASPDLRAALDTLLALDENRFDAIALVAREEVRAALKKETP